MKKLMTLAAAAAAMAFTALAEDEAKSAAVAHPPPDAAAEKEAAEAVGEEEDKVFEAGFDNDLLTAYVWRNAVMNDRAVWQPCVWGDLTAFDPFWAGFSIWQNWDLTKRRAADGYQRAMNETEYNIHIGATAWETDDEAWSLGFEFGHAWTVYRHREGATLPSENEFYLKMTLDNPYVNFYAQYSQAYKPISACYFEGGFNRDFALTDALSAGLDWNMSFGSGKYLTYFLYDVGGGRYDPEEEEFEDAHLGNGVGGTTLKGNLTWQICDHFSLGAVLAYTATLNSEARESMREAGFCHTYAYGMVWGGLQAKISF